MKTTIETPATRTATVTKPSRSRTGKKATRKSRVAGRKSSSKGRAARNRSDSSRGEVSRRGRPPVHGSKVIEVLFKDGNPRRPGTWGYKSFGLYKKGMTVSEYFAAGGRSNDLAWDIAKGFVKLAKA